MLKVKVGMKVKDVVTGMEGTVVGITTWLTGCDTVGIHPGLKSDGTPHEHYWVDITRVEVQGEGVCLPNSEKAETKKGGPQPIPQKGY